jgi:parallel beta-helix repeat protein
VFDGDKWSDLEKILTDNVSISVRSQNIVVDKPIIAKLNHVTIDFGKAKVSPSKSWIEVVNSGNSQAVLDLEHSKDIVLNGGYFFGLEAILIDQSQDVVLSNISVDSAPGYGVMVAPNSENIVIVSSQFKSLGASAIAILNDVENVLIAHNQIKEGAGGSNQHAGILLTDRRKFNKKIGGANFLLNPHKLEDGSIVYHGPPEDLITDLLKPPKKIYIIQNEIRNNKSSGIYVDGAVLNYIKNNIVESNSKEGICLDNGSIGNILLSNDIVANGRRWGKSDRDLQLDFVDKFGRMEDTTANAKLPGISIDNSAFNAIVDNHIGMNYGSGIKMVRTAFYNIIGRNVIESNNAGKNKAFFFFGIELGGAKPDVMVADLDFTPSMGNIIFQNIITGAHYSGIQFCGECDFNDVFDNIIMRPSNWAIEQTNPQGKNIFTNNFSTALSRNANLNNINGRVLLGGENKPD